MYVNTVQSVNHALLMGYRLLHSPSAVQEPSRNGPVLVAPFPVTTFTVFPTWRVLSVPERGDNPFFHLIEALWMLAGRRDLAPLKAIVKQIGAYSDDGGRTQPGAYGYRWRRWFNYDQLDWAIKRLKKDPNDRRVVISMWDAHNDPRAADAGSADVPCNTQINFRVRNGALDMMVTCRSNDMLWGAHGANAVHFSVLQEYLAGRLGLAVGQMWQVSFNYHLYTSKANPELHEVLMDDRVHLPDFCHYVRDEAKPYPMFDTGERADAWDEDLYLWWADPSRTGLRHSFFRRVATPVLYSHQAFRDKSDPDRFVKAQEVISQCGADDWRLACSRWLTAAEKRYNRAADDGAQI